MFEFKLPDMSCSHCEATVTKAVLELDPQARVEVDLSARRVRVESRRDRPELAEALTAAGYPPA